MSTDWYLECLDHSPVLQSSSEVEQHTRGLNVIVNMVERRAEYIKADELADGIDMDSLHRNALRFIKQHPHCHMQLKSEYGDIQELPSTHKQEFQPEQGAVMDILRPEEEPAELETETQCYLPHIGWVKCPNPEACANPRRRRAITPWQTVNYEPRETS